MQIRLLHNLARSGGTLISRCLGSMENVILLSEINPQGLNTFNPLVQAHKWHDLLTVEDVGFLNTNKIEFPAAIAMIAERCEERGSRLVLRDWSHLDFIGVPYATTLSYKFNLSAVLKGNFSVIETATVRHPLDVWLSMRRMAPMQGKLTLDVFLHGYLQFARCSTNTGFIKYEDIVSDPDRYLGLLCDRLEIRFDPAYKDRWSQYKKITGDPFKRSRGGDTIRSVPRRSYEPELNDALVDNEDYQLAIKLLGYEHPG